MAASAEEHPLGPELQDQRGQIQIEGGAKRAAQDILVADAEYGFEQFVGEPGRDKAGDRCGHIGNVDDLDGVGVDLRAGFLQVNGGDVLPLLILPDDLVERGGRRFVRGQNAVHEHGMGHPGHRVDFEDREERQPLDGQVFGQQRDQAWRLLVPQPGQGLARDLMA